MADPLLGKTLFINDEPHLPRCHRQLLNHVWSQAAERAGWAVVWAAELRPQWPASWSVKDWVARRLYLKAWALRRSLSQGTSLVVDGFLWPNRPEAFFAALERGGPLIFHGKTLVDCPLLLIRHEAFHRSALRETLPGPDAGYDAISSWRPAGAVPLPELWQPRPPSLKGEPAALWDLRPFPARPWLNAASPFSPQWIREMRASLGSSTGRMPEWLEQDLAEGLVRPSLEFEWNQEEGTGSLPGWWLDFDAQFRGPETALSRQQTALVLSRDLIERMNYIRRRVERLKLPPTTKKPRPPAGFSLSLERPMNAARRNFERAQRKLVYLRQQVRARLLPKETP